MDPCIDDCVTWARKLDQLNRAVHFDVLPNMAHGFLNVSLVVFLACTSYILI